jgi:hypothetical protein
VIGVVAERSDLIDYGGRQISTEIGLFVMQVREDLDSARNSLGAFSAYHSMSGGVSHVVAWGVGRGPQRLAWCFSGPPDWTNSH